MKKTVTIKKYAGGTADASTSKIVAKKSKPVGTYARETTTTSETKAPIKGKLYIKEGTVQRKPTGGVDFVPKEKESSISNSKGRIVDPKSKKVESSSQASLRKATLDVHKDVDLSKRYKQGDDITYQTKKGPQVAGRVDKTPDTPGTYKTTTIREIEMRKKSDVKDSGGNPKKGAEYKAQGYKNQAGTYKYVKPDESKFVPEHEVDAHIAKGYSRSDTTKKNLEKKAKGAKKMMFGKGC